MKTEKITAAVQDETFAKSLIDMESPEEVKKASVGIKTATKAQMIEWAVAKHPEANWPTYKQHGEDVISEAKAEHMADAVATIYAGLSCQPFQQMLALIKRSAT